MTKKKSTDFLWVEKYRPQQVKHVVLPKHFKTFFNKVISGGEIPNLLLYSSTPGAGKTTIAKAICNDIGADSIYINISSESGIDTLRSTIQQFASTKSFNQAPKVVIMDEADGASPQLQAGLRAFIEEFHSHCRFILTCNYISKIIEPLREGRIMEFDFNMNTPKDVAELKPKMCKHLVNVCKAEEIEADPKILSQLVESAYPNMRKMIATLQKASTMYGIIDNNTITLSKVDTKLYDLILGRKFTEAIKLIIESKYDMAELYPAFYRDLVPRVDDKGKQAQIILILADYQHRHATAIDPEITLAACLLEIIGVI
tara:strand:- start:924 stop:1868 length:945 start_codon:yes stop_codon:yes gene_type:complete